jgi:hypothetical protein
MVYCKLFRSTPRAMSFEITADHRSECFRDLVAEAFVDIVGERLQYGCWTVVLRTEHEVLYVAMTCPDDTRREWGFAVSDVARPADLAAQLWKDLTRGDAAANR